MDRYITKELKNEISKTGEGNKIKNVPEVWKKLQQKEVWEQVRGLYSLESKEILLQTMQLYSTKRTEQGVLSPFSEKVSKKIMQHLSKYSEFRCSPQGQKLEKQRIKQFGNPLSFLPHEVALASRRFEAELRKFDAWHRNESIKAGGNAVVPQIVLMIFKAIDKYENLNPCKQN